MKKPFVSIIIIGYNIEKYVASCIESALNQNYSETEIVFVDDGSKDNTLNIVKMFKGYGNIRIIEKRNGGIVSARKEGLKNSNGEFVCFVDGDDWMNPEMISSLMERAESVQYDIDIVASNLYWQTDTGDFLIVKNKVKMNNCSGDEYFRYIMLDDVDHHMFPRVYRKQFLINADYYNYCNVSMAEDLMTNALVGLYKPRVLFSDSVNYYYRYNPSSMIRKGNLKLLEQKKTLHYMENYIKTFGLDNIDSLIEFQWFSYAFCYVQVPEQFMVKKRIIEECKNNTNNVFINEYVKKVINTAPRRYKYLFKLDYCATNIARIMDSFFFFALSNYKKLRNKKENISRKIFFSSMKVYYREKTRKMQKNNNMERVYLIGTSDRSNIGDHIIGLSESRFLKSVFPKKEFIEITGDHYRHDKNILEKIITPESPIFITGGGFLGDLWMEEELMVRDVIKRFPDNK
ncbi:MAG: glycosyltransferase, partial [Ruminococcus flavefaciens]|nr:glycosyltransferase [Ruminococcus flavefaciens]